MDIAILVLLVINIVCVILADTVSAKRNVAIAKQINSLEEKIKLLPNGFGSLSKKLDDLRDKTN